MQAGSKPAYFFSQPHQPFFFAGIVWAVAVMLLFGLSYKGILFLQVSPLLFHAYTLLFTVFTPFFTGFIFTTFPRFCQSGVIAKTDYLGIFALLQFGSVLTVAGALLSLPLMAAGSLVLLVSHLRIVSQLQRIYQTGYASTASSDPFWILTGFYFGALSHLLFAVEITTAAFGTDAGLLAPAAAVGIWLYLIFVAFAVGQRMVPFFSHVMTQKRRYFTATVFGLLVLKSILELVGFSWPELFVDTVLGLYILTEFRRWKLPFRHSPAILQVLHLALFWLPAALLVGALLKTAAVLFGFSAAKVTLHMAAIGFVVTILIGFGTRVTLGHSGQTPHADRFAVALFALVQLLVSVRALYALFSGAFWLFDLSFTLWLLLFVLWGGRYGPVLVSGKKL